MPLLTLGVPGGGATAVLLGAFIKYWIQPGPLLFQNRPDLVGPHHQHFYIGNIMLVILNLPLIGIFVRLLYIPTAILYPLIIAISVIGAYAINGSMTDLPDPVLRCRRLHLRQADIPIAPLVLARARRHHGTVVPAGDDDLRRQPADLREQHHHHYALVVMSVISIITPFILARMKSFRNVNLAEAD